MGIRLGLIWASLDSHFQQHARMVDRFILALLARRSHRGTSERCESNTPTLNGRAFWAVLGKASPIR